MRIVKSCFLAVVEQFLRFMQKYAEDAEVSELCGATPPYPVRFPELKCIYVAYLQYGHQLRGG